MYSHQRRPVQLPASSGGLRMMTTTAPPWLRRSDQAVTSLWGAAINPAWTGFEHW